MRATIKTTMGQSRVTATADTGERVSIGKAYDTDWAGNHLRAARALCEKIGHTGSLRGAAVGESERVYSWIDPDGMGALSISGPEKGGAA